MPAEMSESHNGFEQSLLPTPQTKGKLRSKIATPADEDSFGLAASKMLGDDEVEVDQPGPTKRKAKAKGKMPAVADAESGEFGASEEATDDPADRNEDIGDDARILGPDDDGDDLDIDPLTAGLTSGKVPKASEPLLNDSIDDRFRAILTSAIKQLQDWAKAQDGKAFFKLENDDRAMTPGFFNLLRRCSVEKLVGIYMDKFPRAVRALFSKETWTKEDFLELPEVEDDDCAQGIYGDFATGDLRHKSDIECDAYVGSAKDLKDRVKQHRDITQWYADTTLPRRMSGSRHYKQICRKGVTTNFRKLAGFPEPVSSGYLILLEGICVILFDTFKYHDYVAKFATKASYDLVSEIRSKLNLPAVPWYGMNAAWPIRQGFVNLGCKLRSPCGNPACGVTTYPNGDETKHRPRYLHDTEDVLGAYICEECYKWRKKTGELPGKEQTDSLMEKRDSRAAKGYEAARKAAGDDPICRGCDILQSEEIKALGKNHGTFQIPKALPGVLCCMSCMKFVNKNGRLRNAEEKGVSVLKRLRTRGGKPICAFCGGEEGAQGVAAGKFTFIKKVLQVLCSACKKGV